MRSRLVALVISIRVFAAEKHNATNNRHRQTALQTFASFQHATDRPELREAVLLQASQAIFSPLATGYIKSTVDVQDVPLGLASILRSGGKKE